MNHKIKDTFDEIHADEELKLRTFEYISSKRKRALLPSKRRSLIMACCVLTVFIIGTSYSYFTPVSAISIDINPSVEMEINRFDRVISTTGYNQDGNSMLSSINLKHLNYMDALDKLTSSETLSNYMEDETFVEITVVSDSDNDSERLLRNITKFQTSSKHNITCHGGNSELVAIAHTAGLSFGKYQAFLELQKFNPNLTIEDVKDMSMRQIRDMIANYNGSSHIHSKGQCGDEGCNSNGRENKNNR